jgi:type II secretory ATPase GspE/PulE/Tfp pilus assembly ATPase PilB-like protein
MRPLFAARSVVERLIELLYPATETETTTLPPPATPKLARPQLPPPQQWHDGDASGDQGRDAPRAREAAVAEAGKTQVDVPAAAANPGQPRREPEVELKRLLGEAIKAGATELHFEPLPGTGGRLRWRVDGELGEPTFLSTETYGALLDRLKSLAGIDAATQRPVCSGAFDLRQSGRRLRVRLHCCQSSCGETLLARLVDPSELPPRLSEVGFDRRQREAIEASLHGDGLILVTGPSGQGQRTTLYSCFDLLDPDAKSLWTVEDSAAYRLAGVTQIETAREPLMSGAQAVDAFRRQAADALLLGSLADATSASHCVAAAMAGRLVLCGVAAEDAVSAIGTVRQLGVPDALLGNRLRLIIVQRCLRRLCDRCKVPDWLDEETRRRWNLPAERSVRAPRGCDHCDQTGYRGRVPVFDVVPVTAESQRLIGSGASADPLRSSLAGDATSFLFEQALQRLCEGATSLDEILTLPQVRTTSDASKMLT